MDLFKALGPYGKRFLNPQEQKEQAAVVKGNASKLETEK
jgi:hypothetical protein